MNLRDLQYLVAVADAQHFGRAAEACHVSQPTLSMQLKKLEDYLGVQLFERTNKQVMITPIGHQLAERARRMLRDAAEIRAVAAAARDPLAGDFHLGAFPTLAPYFLPKIMPTLTEKLPKLKFWLVEAQTDALLEKITSGALDAALIALPIDDDRLSSAALFDDPFSLAVPPGHRLAKRKRIQLEDFATERLLLLEDGHCLRSQALEICSLIGAGEQHDFRATSLETLRQMVASGLGITLIPKLAQQKQDGITYLPIHPTISREIGLVWRKTSPRMPCINAILATLGQAREFRPSTRNHFL